MQQSARTAAIDYLIIGHLTLDQTPHGLRLGGTAAYSALTAQALGLRVGLVSAWGASEMHLQPLRSRGVALAFRTGGQTTTFENISTSTGRVQRIRNVAEPLTLAHIPLDWRPAPIVHLAPVAQEIPPELARAFPDALVLITAQGWLRQWDADGVVNLAPWERQFEALTERSVLILSEEDLRFDGGAIAALAESVAHLLVTCGADGAQLYLSGARTHFAVPNTVEVDAIGAGDIFATAYGVRFQRTHNPLEAVQFANFLAAASVSRTWLESIPQPAEIQAAATL